MGNKHSLLSYLQKAEEDENEDHHLAFYAKPITEFFKDEGNKKLWKQRLASLEDLDLKISPLFEAIWLFGQWRIEKDYKKGLESAQKFEEMERIAYEKNWNWVLTYSFETAIYIYKALNYREKIGLLCKEIVGYIKEKKETFPTHTVFELARLFNSVIINAKSSAITGLYKILIEFSERDLSRHFQRSFLAEAIEIAKFLKLDEDVKAFQEKTILSLIEEAEDKGKKSKLVKAAFLQQALEYSAQVGNKQRIQQLKKELSQTNYSDELKEITLPKEELDRFVQVIEQHYKNVKISVEKYVDKLSKQPPLQILWNVCNDDSIIRINLKRTKEFVDELMRKHPIQQLFPTMLDTGEKSIQIKSAEDKERFKLNEQLIPYAKETIWLVTQIFKELKRREILTSAVIKGFLSNCSCVSQKNLELICAGAFHHFEEDYIASISILTPLFESILFDYLSSLGADISSYQGEVTERRELGGLINAEEVQDELGENFQYFLKLFLVEPDSFNFRNRFAHGVVKVSEFNESTSSIILYLILKTCSKTLRLVDTAEQ